MSDFYTVPMEIRDFIDCFPEPAGSVRDEQAPAGKARRPRSIFFFSNGNTAVCDQAGEQMAQYQRGHRESINLLQADGIDWTALKVYGCPNCLS